MTHLDEKLLSVAEVFGPVSVNIHSQGFTLFCCGNVFQETLEQLLSQEGVINDEDGLANVGEGEAHAGEHDRDVVGTLAVQHRHFLLFLFAINIHSW